MALRLPTVNESSMVSPELQIESQAVSWYKTERGTLAIGVGVMKGEVITEKLRQELYQMCESAPGILAVYLFGSRAKGEDRPDSDIDLAFLFERGRFEEDRFDALRVAETFGYEVTRLLGARVDVTLLNAASLEFAHAVVEEAFLLYERDKGERILYEVVLENEYEEFKPFIEDLRRAKLNSLASGSAEGH